VRSLRIAIVPFLCVALITGIIGCGGSGEATSPEGQEIQHFLKDKNVNSVLWEEWNIFDEYSLTLSIYENDSPLLADYGILYNQRQALKDRAADNYADIASISPPLSLSGFWASITDAMKSFSESYELNPPISTFWANQAVKKMQRPSCRSVVLVDSTTSKWNGHCLEVHN